jgi:hypothetical protein
LECIDDVIREAIGTLNQNQVGGLTALFLTGEQTKRLAQLTASKAAREQQRDLKRLDTALQQGRSQAAHSAVSAASKRS